MKVNPATLVAVLEQPYNDTGSRADIDRRASLMAGLGWLTNYWIDLALNWIEQGYPLDSEIVEMLEAISSRKELPQKTRHRAFSFAKRWRKANHAKDT